MDHKDNKNHLFLLLTLKPTLLGHNDNKSNAKWDTESTVLKPWASKTTFQIHTYDDSQL